MITLDKYGNPKEEYLTISLVELSLTTTVNNIIRTSNDNSYYYTCKWNGASGEDIDNRKLTYYFYKESNLNSPALTIEKPITKISETSEKLNLSSL
jgi:hypothetical protein